MRLLKFSATIQINPPNPYVLVSAEQAAILQADWRKPMPVLVRVNSQPNPPWHINMMPIGNGDFYLYLHNDVRTAAGATVGDRVDVELQFDKAYRGGPTQPMPDWFATALAANAAARANWEALPPSRQKEVIRYFARLKSGAAKARNLERAMRALSDESGRFMGRSWQDGR